jgi:hypothetical protein
LRVLEAEQARVEQAIADATKNAKVKDWLDTMKPAEARKLIGEWCIQDAWTIEERRAALGALVERIEFDTATGKGRIHYRIGPVRRAGRGPGSRNRGNVASPRQTAAKPAIKFVRRLYLRGFRRCRLPGFPYSCG